MTTDKILDKLAKLKAARDGEAQIGNSKAAEAFAEAINRLLLQHELSEADIPMPGAPEEPIVELLADLRAHGIKFSKVRIGWQEALARVVARAHLCKFLVTPGTNYVTFVGTKAHAEVARYAYGVLASAADRMSNEARDEYWRLHRNDPDFRSGNYRAAWLHGFIERISERFQEALKHEAAATGSSSTALIRLQGALVRAEAYVKERYSHKASATHMQTGISKGREEGRRAADAMRLGQRGVEAGGARKGLKGA